MFVFCLSESKNLPSPKDHSGGLHPILQTRVDAALEIADGGHFKVIFFGSAIPDNPHLGNKSEIFAMCQYAQKKGLQNFSVEITDSEFLEEQILDLRNFLMKESGGQEMNNHEPVKPRDEKDTVVIFSDEYHIHRVQALAKSLLGGEFEIICPGGKVYGLNHEQVIEYKESEDALCKATLEALSEIHSEELVETQGSRKKQSKANTVESL